MARHIGARLSAFDIGRNMGAINPHEGRFPAQVMQALFVLLLQPWEDWHTDREIDWRPFTVPWVHVVTEDIFERTNPFPSPDSLTWEPAFDQDGNEYERPAAYHFCGDTHAGLAHVDEAYWMKLQAARVSPLFKTPIEHFMLRAFFSDGIDEIIAHITVIKAALGLQSDFTKVGRNRHPKMPPTHRVTRRVQILLDDDAAGNAYARLFDIARRPLPSWSLVGPGSSSFYLGLLLAEVSLNPLGSDAH
ncbi:hypothetical protein [Roseomonas populi]|uniref:Uncharacterized protein n=1 Tax=Roseomonas populi TaxID=3121582 RepID=A0ABT1X6V8_9PROT|nr:hypothetical protein [Roseomonas pecuniae]MCR0983133.1 hypothetical protein [Roseomonas pecuniae]